MYKISEEIQFIGKEIIFLPKCRSTNDIAAEMWKQEDLPNGSLIITDYQYGGRGQRGNIWISEANKNLTFSLVIKPSFIQPINNFHLNIITSLSIIDALNQAANPQFKIKWPNDIMFNDQKLAGILIENNIQASRIENSIVGIGLNVNQTEFKKIPGAVSLRTIFNKTQNLNDILNRILLHFELLYQQLANNGINDLKKRYTENLYWINEEHFFKSSAIFKGIITGIDDSGYLIVRVDGKEQKYNFKEISFIK